jgi:hypothetical protein
MVGLLLLSVSKHNMWSYYGWLVVVVRQFALYVVVIRLDFSLVSSISNQNMWTWLGLSLSSFSKHNAWSYRYYGWVYCCRRRQ